MNKNPSFRKQMLFCASTVALAAGIIAGCSHSRSQDEIKQEASHGPVILNPRSTPDHVELNRFLQAKEPQQFFAEIQDFASPVTAAKLRLAGTSIEIPMEKVSGTTWRGQLSDDQLKRLAISGQKVKYQAQVLARDQNGVIASSKEGIEVSVSAPKFEPDAG